MANTSPKILLVDDEKKFLNSMGQRLKLLGFDPVKAVSGREAIALAKNSRLDLAIVDLKMPGINGEETLKALKAEHRWMEIVILTGHGTIDSAVECTKSGAFSYLQKPCSLEELLDSLKNAYKKKVMNRKKIEEKKMDEMLKVAYSGSAREVLRRLREIDNRIEDI